MSSSLSQIQYSVPGMSCAHCVASITGEVSEVNGVTGVSIDLDTKLVTITGTDLEDAALRAAIDEAGFEVTG